MEIKSIDGLNNKLELTLSRIENVNTLIENVNQSLSKSMVNMNSVSNKLSDTSRLDANKMQNTMRDISKRMSKSINHQKKKFNSVTKRLLNQKDNIKALNNDNQYYPSYEIDFYIKEIKQDLKNIDSWNAPTYDFKKIDFENHGGLRGMIFTPIAEFNRKSEALAKELYEIERLLNEISKETLNVELEKLKANSPLQSSDTLAEQISGFKVTQESHTLTENTVDVIDIHRGKCGCGGLGRTGFCG